MSKFTPKTLLTACLNHEACTKQILLSSLINQCGKLIDIERRKIDCLSFVMCPLLAPLIIGFFSFFFCCGHLQY